MSDVDPLKQKEAELKAQLARVREAEKITAPGRTFFASSRKIGIASGTLTLLVLIIVLTSNHNSTPETVALPETAAALPPPPPAVAVPNSDPASSNAIDLSPKAQDILWQYDDSYDQMRDRTTYYATLPSQTTLHFDWPYTNVNPSIELRSGNGTDVMLKIDNGQFMTDYDGTAIAVKGDNNPIQHFTGMESDNGSTTVLFIEPASRFISLLKKSKHITVEAPFYEAGREQMEFDCTGLNWPRGKP